MRRLSRNFWIIINIFSVGIACQPEKADNQDIETMEHFSKDPHSFSKPEEAVIKHIELELKVDFHEKILGGQAKLMLSKGDNSKSLFLDTKDLKIRRVTDSDGRKLPFKLHQKDSILGTPLEIDISDLDGEVKIDYVTSPQAEALQWLKPAQTADKTDPFLFTQSQAILARSWIPLQDSPGIRFTYKARVEVPQGMLALMSAENPQVLNDDGIYEFTMPQPIPSYLMALAVGKIDFAPVGARTGVYAEPGMLEKSRREFSEMEDMLVIAEELYGKYRWGRYDLIVLPPSFPFGGMENPRITFATPTILAGDKSLTSLVAHELAHSWSGNLVTNATWNDFWLNEGFTVYFEHRIMEALKGKDYADMLSSLSLQGLLAEVDLFWKGGREDETKLKLDLSGRNPDDGVTTIAYDKGYFFLYRLEEYVGREKFDEFLSSYFREHAFQSNYTESFLVYLNKNLFEKNGIDPIEDLEEWIYGTGLPASMPTIRSIKFEEVDESIQMWMKNDKSLNTSNWSSHEWVHFIKNLPMDISLEAVQKLDQTFNFTSSGNSEILGVWFVHCVRTWHEDSFDSMSDFLINTGRRKFLLPIYKELTNSEKGKNLALEIYSKARPNYHFVSSSSLDTLLN